MCTFNKVTGETYKKFIKGILCFRLILSNDKKISNLKELSCIYFYRPPERRKNYLAEKKLLQIIKKYCFEKLKLVILCKFLKNTRKGNHMLL